MYLKQLIRFGFHNSCFIRGKLKLSSDPNSVLTVIHWELMSAKPELRAH